MTAVSPESQTLRKQKVSSIGFKTCGRFTDVTKALVF